MTDIERAIAYFDGYGSPYDDLVITALRERKEGQNPKPLTLEELRQMDGQPVFVHGIFDNDKDGYGIVDVSFCYRGVHGAVIQKAPAGKGIVMVDVIDDYGKTWLAYRHKLEIIKEETDGAK